MAVASLPIPESIGCDPCVRQDTAQELDQCVSCSVVPGVKHRVGEGSRLLLLSPQM